MPVICVGVVFRACTQVLRLGSSTTSPEQRMQHPRTCTRKGSGPTPAKATLKLILFSHKVYITICISICYML
jgi:hypothetical protein